MLDYFKELHAGHPDIYKSEFILWNNKEIGIENKSIFWAHLSEQGIYFVHDLLDKHGKFLSLENVQRKYTVLCKGNENEFRRISRFVLFEISPNFRSIFRSIRATLNEISATIRQGKRKIESKNRKANRKIACSNF